MNERPIANPTWKKINTDKKTPHEFQRNSKPQSLQLNANFVTKYFVLYTVTIKAEGPSPTVKELKPRKEFLILSQKAFIRSVSLVLFPL